MRKVFWSLSLSMIVLSSCNSDDIVNIPMEQNELSTYSTRSSSENMLSFSSEEEYNALLDSLKSLSDGELMQWEAQYGGFKSMYKAHTEALDQLLLSKNKVEYESTKKIYQSTFIFNDKDDTDLSIYMPVLDVSKAVTLNQNGLVRISGEVKDMRDFNNYEGYQRKLSTLYPIKSRVTIENGINKVHVKTKKRKFSAQIGRRGNLQAIRVNASKKFLWGWIEYTTAYYWKLTPNGPALFGNKIKSGHDIIIQKNLFPNGTKLYMWTRGTGEENCGIMTVQL